MEWQETSTGTRWEFWEEAALAVTPNIPLLRKVLDHIDAHPREWYQGEWGIQTSDSPCGTAFCVAGHAAMLSGAKPIFYRSGSQMLMTQVEMDGETVPVEPLATKLLGLTWEEAVGLFDSDNDRERVQDIAEGIARRAGDTL